MKRDRPSRRPGADPGMLARALALGLVLLVTLSLPASAADRDGDKLKDWFETKYGVTSPDDPDSDGDGVVDSAEDLDGDRLGNLGEQRFGTHPGKPDSDGDGRSDGREDHDRDGRSNAKEQDQRRLPSGLRPTLAKAPDDSNDLKVWCSTVKRSSKVKRCEFGPADADTTIVFMGDSHAHALLSPMKRSAEQEGWRLVTLLKGACIPYLGLDNPYQYELDRNKTCRAWRRGALEWLDAQDPAPDLIVITHSDRYPLINGKGRKLPKWKWPSLWKAGLARTLDRMPAASGVLVLGDVPKNFGDPVKCLRSHRDDISACVSARQPLSKRRIEKALRKGAAANGAMFRTLFGKICTYDPCPLVQGDILMWRDKTHLTTTFSRRLTPSVRQILAESLP